jgi:hypothetical protein
MTGACLAVFFAAGSSVQAQDRGPRRLESVTWNSVEHKLTWVVSTGKPGDTQKPAETKTYKIDMDAAIMTFNEENRRFSSEEAASVHALMDLLSKYAVESTVWWEAGQGQRIDKNSKPEPAQSPHDKRPPVKKKQNRDLTVAQNRVE